jgi:hypothetical protein
VTILITDNRLPGKPVLAETADKQKAVPKEAEFASFGTVLRCSKMRKNRGFRWYFGANSGSAMANIFAPPM